jgi:hypothetical protein
MEFASLCFAGVDEGIAGAQIAPGDWKAFECEPM